MWDLAFELLTNRASESGPQPQGLVPVYRFWSEKLAGHFYTIDEAEKNKLIREQSQVWTFEGVVFTPILLPCPPAASRCTISGRRNSLVISIRFMRVRSRTFWTSIPVVWHYRALPGR
jgi:hypothetical protein